MPPGGNKGWRRGEWFCEAKNRDGSDCGNKIGVARGYCHVHKRMSEQRRREAREAAVQGRPS